MQPHNPETPELSSQSLSPLKLYTWAKSASWHLAPQPFLTGYTKFMVSMVAGGFSSVCIKFLEEAWYMDLWEAIWSGRRSHRAADLYFCPSSNTHYLYNLGRKSLLICLCCHYTICWGGEGMENGGKMLIWTNLTRLGWGWNKMSVVNTLFINIRPLVGLLENSFRFQSKEKWPVLLSDIYSHFILFLWYSCQKFPP